MDFIIWATTAHFIIRIGTTHIGMGMDMVVDGVGAARIMACHSVMVMARTGARHGDGMHGMAIPVSIAATTTRIMPVAGMATATADTGTAIMPV